MIAITPLATPPPPLSPSSTASASLSSSTPFSTCGASLCKQGEVHSKAPYARPSRTGRLGEAHLESLHASVQTCLDHICTGRHLHQSTGAETTRRAPVVGCSSPAPGTRHLPGSSRRFRGRRIRPGEASLGARYYEWRVMAFA